mmetsp:Transcript_25725/g.41123  ORF Transcript_25725/g.41123 Transcript_25725/m.41123 type:complete len:244 (-) Transcript_25725:4804-5535(-)
MGTTFLPMRVARSSMLVLVCITQVALNAPAAEARALVRGDMDTSAMERQKQIKVAGQHAIRLEETVADYLESLKELGKPKPDPAGTQFNSSDRASCPRDARGCASDAAVRAWLLLAEVLPVSTTRSASAADTDVTNLVAYSHIPRALSLDVIHSYLRAVAVEAPERLTPDVLKAVGLNMASETLAIRRYTVAETLEDIKARIAHTHRGNEGNERTLAAGWSSAESSAGPGTEVYRVRCRCVWH